MTIDEIWELWHHVNQEVAEVCSLFGISLRAWLELAGDERYIILSWYRLRNREIVRSEDITSSRSVSNGEEAYSYDMPGMTLDEFQAWSDEVIREYQST